MSRPFEFDHQMYGPEQKRAKAASFRAVGDWNAAAELTARDNHDDEAANRHWRQAKAMWRLAAEFERKAA